MPHLLIAGTTGVGQSVAINTMICRCSIGCRARGCRLIMIDRRM